MHGVRGFVPALIAGWLVLPATAIAQVDQFRPIGFFLVPEGGLAEVISATPDGNTLAYTNSILRRVGVVDISDPRDPQQLYEIPLDGSPTSVSVTPDGSMLLVVVNTSTISEGDPPRIRPGRVEAYRVADGEPLGSLRTDYGPDSVQTTVIGDETVALIALENESTFVDDEFNVVEDGEPGDPGIIAKKGFVTLVRIDFDDFSKSRVKNIFMPKAADLEAEGLLFGNDPQPEYIAFHGTTAAVSLQENNGIALIDLADLDSPRVTRVFDLEVPGDQAADLIEDGRIDFSGVYPGEIEGDLAGTRIPDGIAWNAAGTMIITADEGEFDLSGGRGFSAWTPEGEFMWSDGGAVEAAAVTIGQYQEARSENKGIEMEGAAIAVFGSKEFAFTCSERGGFLAVTDITDSSSPVLVQVLPTGIAPEMALVLPQRNLVLTADEGDDGSGTISFFEGVAGEYMPDPARPTIRSDGTDQGFGALSALAADPGNPNLLYSVPDDALQSEIYTIEVGGPIARLARLARVMQEAVDPETGESSQVQATFDLEGIAVDTSTVADPENPGFWLSSEGNAAFGEADYRPNLLIQVTRSGEVVTTIKLPEDIDPAVPPPVDPPEGEEPPPEPEPIDPIGKVRSNGFEGNTISSNGEFLLAAIQRNYQGEVAVDGVLYTRIARYSIAGESWEFFLYPLDPGLGTIGLSEITNLGNDVYAVIERDNQWGGLAAIKRVYSFTLEGVEPFGGRMLPDQLEGLDLTGKVIEKTLLFDVLEDFVPFEKVEGLTLSAGGDLWAVLDNDGGVFEPRLVNLGSPGQ